MNRFGSTVALTAALLAGACSALTPRPDPSRFFTLTPITDAAAAPGAVSGRILGIGPVTFPRYLDRPELVTRVGPNEVRNAVSDYWAGSLAKQFESTLAQNLQALLSPSSIVTFPWYSAAEPDAIVEIDVRQFERATDGQAHLVARWRVKKGHPAAVTRAGEFALSRPAPDDPVSTAAELSDLVGELSREIAAAVRAAS
jgi:uncharacterized lipoprotein YmbA